MLTFGMGASTQALFARVGGGIYTKAADVGTDLQIKAIFAPMLIAAVGDPFKDTLYPLVFLGICLHGKCQEKGKDGCFYNSCQVHFFSRFRI